MTIASASLPDSESVVVLGATHAIRIRHTAYSVIESCAAPGSGLPPHALDGQDQSIYVLEGEFRFVIGDERRILTAGSTAFVPRDTVHSLTASGAEPARCLTIVSPHGAWETFLDEIRAANAASAALDIYAIARRAGIALLTSPV